MPYETHYVKKHYRGGYRRPHEAVVDDVLGTSADFLSRGGRLVSQQTLKQTGYYPVIELVGYFPEANAAAPPVESPEDISAP
jgi:hypothetical protein